MITKWIYRSFVGASLGLAAAVGAVSATMPVDAAVVERTAEGGQDAKARQAGHAQSDTEVLVRLHREAIGQYVASRAAAVRPGCCEVARVAH